MCPDAELIGEARVVTLQSAIPTNFAGEIQMQIHRYGLAILASGALLSGVAGAVVASSHGVAAPVATFFDDDPVTGDWDAVLSSDMMPEDQEVLVTLELDGDTVTGGFTAQGETAPFEGEWDADSGTITGVLTDPDQGLEFDVELTIDGDEMTGVITIEIPEPEMTIILDLTATRAM